MYPQEKSKMTPELKGAYKSCIEVIYVVEITEVAP